MCERGGAPPALENVTVFRNERIADGVGLLALHAPRCAREVRPGQFVHLRIASGTDFILRRPFSVHRASGETIEILYQVLGTGTRAMSLLERDATLDLIGPLGTGWSIAPRMEHALIVTGGLGAAPLGMLAEELSAAGVAITVAMGAPCAERLVAREVYDAVARRVVIATDDGSSGERGFVTVLTMRLLATESFDCVYVCGPEIMQRIVARQASAADVTCQVSLERLMACGIGACLSCVVSTRDGRKRACVDGPVFDAGDVLWDCSEVPPKH
ncbi:MAG: dihydroorotate dehydrogenase electron transfer subunit [Actinobacteria bacterium HGW-Actinobacteria-10]|nr:MAG: dihydroorotate dehydrogenase electron transfer subunit [Actinobacteria bacterium HGW-Actinobacteria-10]